MCKVLSERGATLYPVVRQSSADLDGLDLHGGKVVTGIDMAADCSDALAAALAGVSIDALMANAGALTYELFDSSSIAPS
jgi:hypothetical protein